MERIIKSKEHGALTLKVIDDDGLELFNLKGSQLLISDEMGNTIKIGIDGDLEYNQATFDILEKKDVIANWESELDFLEKNEEFVGL